jgi:hypothetical protein
MRIRFDTATCRACRVCSACTWAKEAPRQLTVRPQEQHVAMQAARQRQETVELKRSMPYGPAWRAPCHKACVALIYAGVAISDWALPCSSSSMPLR